VSRNSKYEFSEKYCGRTRLLHVYGQTEGPSDFNKVNSGFSQLLCESTEKDTFSHNLLRQYMHIFQYLKVMSGNCAKPTNPYYA
jgi:hypothetical protein